MKGEETAENNAKAIIEERKRPIGISILAILHIGGGVLLGIMTVILLVIPELRQGLGILGSLGPLIVIGIVFLFALGISSGIGMWKGRKWGWYLGSFYYIYGLFRNFNALIMTRMLMSSMTSEDMADMSRGPAYYYVKHGGRIITYFLLYLYFFKGSVRDSFSLSEQKEWKPILAELGICIGISAIGSILARVAS